MLFGSSSDIGPCISGNAVIKVPKRNMIGVVTRIQNLVLPIRLILECRIRIVPPQKDKNEKAVRIPGIRTIRISSNSDSDSIKVEDVSKVVTSGF